MIPVSRVIEATMLLAHMAICVLPASKNPHTNPTDMCRAGFALHVIAAFGLLDRAATLWAISSIVLLLPVCESVIAKHVVLVLFAGEALMADSSAPGTDGGQTS
jgi:hypothetical protein